MEFSNELLTFLRQNIYIMGKLIKTSKIYNKYLVGFHCRGEHR